MAERVLPNEAGDRAARTTQAEALVARAAGRGARARAVGAARSARGRRHRHRLSRLRVSERADRPLGVGPARLRVPGARRRQRRDPPSVRHRRAEGAMARAARRRRDPFVLLDDRAGGARLRPDDAPHARCARRRRLGDRRAQVVLVRRRRRRVRDRDGRDRPRRRPARARDADHRPGGHAGRRRRAPDPGHGPRAARGWSTHCEVRYTGVRVPVTNMLGDGGRRVPDRAEAARPWAHPPRHALARPDAARVRADVLVRARARDVRRAARRQADGAELDRRQLRRDPGVPADDARRGAQDRRRRRGARRDLGDQVLRGQACCRT